MLGDIHGGMGLKAFRLRCFGLSNLLEIQILGSSVNTFDFAFKNFIAKISSHFAHMIDSAMRSK
jgi:hypothetical protein